MIRIYEVGKYFDDEVLDNSYQNGCRKNVGITEVIKLGYLVENCETVAYDIANVCAEVLLLINRSQNISYHKNNNEFLYRMKTSTI